MLVSSILARKGSFVATIRGDAPLAEASRALALHGIGALVVSSDGTTVEGLISEKHLAHSLATHGSAAPLLDVRIVMDTDIPTCAPTDTCDHLMAVMTEERSRHLPVVDGQAELLGIISIGDVVRERVEELQDETRVLHEYIHTGR